MLGMLVCMYLVFGIRDYTHYMCTLYNLCTYIICIQVALQMLKNNKPVNIGDHIPYVICAPIAAAASTTPTTNEDGMYKRVYMYHILLLYTSLYLSYYVHIYP